MTKKTTKKASKSTVDIKYADEVEATSSPSLPEKYNPYAPIVIGMKPWSKSDYEACERLYNSEHFQTLLRVTERLEKERNDVILGSVWTPEQAPILLSSQLESIRALRELTNFIAHASKYLSQKSA